jgi:hypothetical protein
VDREQHQPEKVSTELVWYTAEQRRTGGAESIGNARTVRVYVQCIIDVGICSEGGCLRDTK